MCGIGGYYKHLNSTHKLEEKLISVASALEHRGPDANLIWNSEHLNIGFCHTRLSIIDINTRANQPMHSIDNKYVLVFNGEIYNYRELRNILSQKGCKFHTESDSEVLIEGYRVWQEKVLDKLEGMFAFAIFDKSNNILFLARDHIGKKPLHYSTCNEDFVFASEIPAIKKLIVSNLEYDFSAISSIFLRNIKNIPAPFTAFKEIKKLRPGSFMRVRNGRILENKFYYRIDKNCLEMKFDKLLEKQVTKRLIADVPIGVMLSGGIDSSLISYITSKKTNKKIKSYSIGSNENDPDIINSQKVAEDLNFDHSQIFYNDKDDLEILKQLIKTNGEPICLLPLIHISKICNEAKKDKIKVLLSGNGADELFYGYDSFVKNYFFSKFLNNTKIISPIINLITFNKLKCFYFASGNRKAELYRNSSELFWSHFIKKDNVKNLNNIINEEMKNLSHIGIFNDYIDESNFLGLMMENSHSLTLGADLAGMNSSVEIRSPFLDKEIINYAFSINSSEKIKLNKLSFISKYPIRKMADKIVPKEIINRSKRGLGFEFDEGKLLSGKWKNIAEDLFLNPNDLNGFFSKKKIIRSWQNFLDGKFQTNAIFKQFIIQIWLQTVND